MTDTCIRCGKDVPKPKGSPPDRVRWADRCDDCLTDNEIKYGRDNSNSTPNP